MYDKKTHTVTAWRYFDRPRLRRITILKGSNGHFKFRVRILDRDTLETDEAVSVWTRETLELVTDLLVKEGELFKEEDRW